MNQVEYLEWHLEALTKELVETQQALGEPESIGHKRVRLMALEAQVELFGLTPDVEEYRIVEDKFVPRKVLLEEVVIARDTLAEELKELA